MYRFSYGVILMNYVQFLNLLGDENFTAKIKYIAPFEFDLIYSIIELYDECVKGPDIMIKDPNLTKQFSHIMRSTVKLVEKVIVLSNLFNFFIVKIRWVC